MRPERSTNCATPRTAVLAAWHSENEVWITTGVVAKPCRDHPRRPRLPVIIACLSVTHEHTIGVMTNQGAPLLTSNMVIGEMGGMLVVFLTLFGIVWWNRRRRDALRERPPEKAKLLRPAGYALQQRLQDVSDKADQAMLHLVGSGAVLGLCMGAFVPALAGLLHGQFTAAQALAPPKRYVFTCAGLFAFGFLLWGARSLLRLLQLTDEVRNYRLGLRGRSEEHTS